MVKKLGGEQPLLSVDIRANGLAAGKVTEATLGQNRINAVIDLKGAEKLLPPAEYKQIIDSALPRAIVHQTSRVFQSFLRPQRSSKARNTHGFG